MAENSRDLTPKQEKAIAALLAHPTVRDAAVECGVSETTLYRWLGEEGFKVAYRDASRKVFDSALNNLQAITGKAVESLRDVLSDVAARPGEKVSAARAILEYALKSREQGELEERLAALEALLKTQGGKTA